MRRFLRGIPDPEPSRDEFAELWQFFENRCAICNRSLTRALREGRHGFAEPGARRAIGNRILLCLPCTWKREKNEWWRNLLRRIMRDPADYVQRATKIEQWQRRHPLPDPPESPRIESCHARAELALADFTAACQDLRAACHAHRRQANATPNGSTCVGGSQYQA
jgi:hypothetical protein